MRTGTFHTFDRYISSKHTSFLVYKEVLLLLLHSLSFFLIAGHVHFRKTYYHVWMGMGMIAFGKKEIVSWCIASGALVWNEIE